MHILAHTCIYVHFTYVHVYVQYTCIYLHILAIRAHTICSMCTYLRKNEVRICTYVVRILCRICTYLHVLHVYARIFCTKSC